MRALAAGLLASSLIFVAAFAADAPEKNWPRFRGPGASGVLEGHATSVSWNLETKAGLAWKTPIPGLAHSSPVVWGDSVFLTTAASAGGSSPLKVGLYGDIEPVRGEPVHRYLVYRIDKRTGRVLWERTAHEGVPRRARHPKSTHANPTPTTDGRRVVVFFGSEGLYCYDPDGKLLNDPFLAAFDLETGRELWRTPRHDVPTWSTPTVLESGGRTVLVVNGWKHIGGYDARTGEEVWRLRGGGDIPVPAPVVAHDLVFITNAHGPASPIFAVRLGAGSSGFTASPVAADGKVYFTSEEGEVYVLRAGEKFELLAKNALGEVTMATPTISEGRIFFRTKAHLVAVGP